MDYIELHWYIGLRWITLDYVGLHWITLDYIGLHWITLDHISLSPTLATLIRLALHIYVTLRYITLRCITLHDITIISVGPTLPLTRLALHAIVHTLHYITLHLQAHVLA